MYNNHRTMEWMTNDNPGFGGSHQDYAGKKAAGNTFDFAYTHGKAVMKAGYPFCSCSNEAFCNNKQVWKDTWSIDLICGKQVTTVIGCEENGTRYTVFTEDMQKTISEYTAAGGNCLVSGAYIATDIWGGIYRYEKDEEFRKASVKFAEMASKWLSQYITASEQVLKISAFILIVVAVFAALALVGKLLEATIKLVMLGWINRLLGMIFSMMKCLLILGLITLAFNSLNNTFGFVKPEYIADSTLYPYLKEFADSVFPYLKSFLTLK